MCILVKVSFIICRSLICSHYSLYGYVNKPQLNLLYEKPDPDGCVGVLFFIMSARYVFVYVTGKLF